MSQSSSQRGHLEVLLVEDDTGDAVLVHESFKRGPCPVNVTHVRHAGECLKFLEKAEPYSDAPTPDLLLVDLIMPEMTGGELIETVLADDRFRHLPVVVLTTIADQSSVRAMYALRCSTYIVKPLSFAELQEITDTIGKYWHGLVRLPTTR